MLEVIQWVSIGILYVGIICTFARIGGNSEEDNC